MKKLKFFLKYFFIILVILLIFVTIFFRIVSTNDEEIIPKNLNLEIKEYENYNFSYVKTNNNKDKVIIFIHGTPGSWDAFLNYLTDEELLNEFEMYSVNRLGFGKSTIKNSKYETSFQKQAEPIIDLMEDIKISKNNSQIIVIGHSLGVSISKRIYFDSPQNVDGFILLAGDVYSEYGKQRWYNILSNNFIGNFIIGKEFMIANKEVATTYDELRIVENAFDNLSIPIIFIQAEDDTIVTPKNLGYMEKMNNENITVIRLEDGNHFIPWNKESIIKAEISNILKYEN